MRNKINCKKHKYIAGRIKQIYETNQIVECEICKKMVFTEAPFSCGTMFNWIISICSSCRDKLKCAGCKKTLGVNRLYLAECVECGHIKFFCAKCKKEKNVLSSGLQKNEKIALKIQIFKKVIEKLKHRLPQELTRQGRFDNSSDGPVYFFFYFNSNFLKGSFDFKEGNNEGANWQQSA